MTTVQSRTINLIKINLGFFSLELAKKSDWELELK